MAIVLSVDPSTVGNLPEARIIIVESLSNLPTIEKVSVDSIKLTIEKMNNAILKAKINKNKHIDLLISIDKKTELSIPIIDIPEKEEVGK